MNTQTAIFGFVAALILTAGSFSIASSFAQNPVGASSLAITASSTTSSSSTSTSTSRVSTTASTTYRSSTTETSSPGTSTVIAPSATVAGSTSTAAPSTSTVASTTSTTVTPTTPTSAPATTSTSAPATTQAPVSTTAPLAPEGRGQAALAQISYPWQEKLPGWTIEFHPERKGYYGLTLVDQKRIEVYVRNDEPTGLLAHVIAHEIGHAVDVTLNSGDDRRQWQEARSITGSPWWPSSAASDFSTGAGDFAESFAAWQVGGGSFRSNLGSVPNGDQLAVMAELASN